MRIRAMKKRTQNEPNLLNAQMNITSFLTKDYERNDIFAVPVRLPRCAIAAALTYCDIRLAMGLAIFIDRLGGSDVGRYRRGVSIGQIGLDNDKAARRQRTCGTEQIQRSWNTALIIDKFDFCNFAHTRHADLLLLSLAPQKYEIRFTLHASRDTKQNGAGGIPGFGLSYLE